MSTAAESIGLGTFPSKWTRRHLLGLEELSAAEITLILDKAEVFKQAMLRGQRKIPLLNDVSCVTLFFENSTRTRTSFSLAARRLGADAVDFSASTSSLSKGETVIDTAKNIEAMGMDMVIVRHRTPGTPHLLAQNLKRFGHQRWRRPARAPDARIARHADHPRATRPHRGPDRGHGRRYRPQPDRPLEHLGPEETRRPRHRVRAFNPGLAPMERTRCRVFLEPGRNLAASGRAEPAAHPVPNGSMGDRSPRFANTPTCTP